MLKIIYLCLAGLALCHMEASASSGLNLKNALQQKIQARLAAYDLISDEDLKAELSEPSSKAAICSQLGQASGLISAYITLAQFNQSEFLAEEFREVENLTQRANFSKYLCEDEKHDLTEFREVLGIVKRILALAGSGA